MRIIDWAALVKGAWGPAYYEPDVAYRMSNSREFKDSGPNSGVYAIRAEAIDQEQRDAGSPNSYPDILTEDFGRLLQE